MLVGLRGPDKDHFLFSRMPISSPNPMFDHLLESSHRDDSNKWSNIGFNEEVTQVELIEVNFTKLIWSSGWYRTLYDSDLCGSSVFVFSYVVLESAIVYLYQCGS